MIKIIEEWIKNPKGNYQGGVAIFKACASTEIRKKYLSYFEKEKGEPAMHALHFTMLINKVCDIRNKAKLNPKILEGVEFTVVKSMDNNELIEQKNQEIEDLKAEINFLEDEIEDLELDVETNAEEIEEKESEIEALELKLEELGADFEKLNERRGVQIVHFDNLPDEIRKLYERVKEITPLMANLHAEISVEKLHHMTRKKLVDQLIDLDDERRAAWDTIDDWSEGKTIEPVQEKVPLEYSTDNVAKGAQMARRIERLKENIIRSEKTLNESDRELIKLNAQKRIDTYKLELEELETQINAGSGTGDEERKDE